MTENIVEIKLCTMYIGENKNKVKKSRCIVQYLPLNSGYIYIRLLQPFTG